MPVAFDELQGSPTYSVTRTERVASRVGKIAWSDIDSHSLELFPPPILGVPQLPALFPGSTSLFADSANYEPFFQDAVATNSGACGASTPIAYSLAKVTIGYKTIPYQQEGDNILTRRISLSVEFMTIPYTGLKWDGETKHIQNPDLQAGKQIPIIEHSLTFHRVPVPDYATIRATVGMVNDATFEGAATGTLLFAGAELRQTITTDGSQPWEIEMRFMEKSIKDGSAARGWNWFFDPAPNQGKFRLLKTMDNQLIYPEADYDLLL